VVLSVLENGYMCTSLDNSLHWGSKTVVPDMPSWEFGIYLPGIFPCT
jgi:hypothetical protein